MKYARNSTTTTTRQSQHLQFISKPQVKTQRRPHPLIGLLSPPSTQSNSRNGQRRNKRDFRRNLTKVSNTPLVHNRVQVLRNEAREHTDENVLILKRFSSLDTTSPANTTPLEGIEKSFEVREDTDASVYILGDFSSLDTTTPANTLLVRIEKRKVRVYTDVSGHILRGYTPLDTTSSTKTPLKGVEKRFQVKVHTDVSGYILKGFSPLDPASPTNSPLEGIEKRFEVREDTDGSGYILDDFSPLDTTTPANTPLEEIERSLAALKEVPILDLEEEEVERLAHVHQSQIENELLKSPEFYKTKIDFFNSLVENLEIEKAAAELQIEWDQIEKAKLQKSTSTEAGSLGGAGPRTSEDILEKEPVSPGEGVLQHNYAKPAVLAPKPCEMADFELSEDAAKFLCDEFHNQYGDIPTFLKEFLDMQNILNEMVNEDEEVDKDEEVIIDEKVDKNEEVEVEVITID